MGDEEGMEVEVEQARKPPVMLESVSKKIQLKARGRVFGVVRENYLRTDIPCRSEVCFESCSHQTEESKKQSILPKDVTHYLIPFTDVANKYMEILEFAEISGVIFPQTVVNSVQQSSMRQYKRICSYIRDARNRSIFFPNEFFKSTYLHRNNSESITEWQNKLVYQVGIWYYEHLGGQKPVVFISEDADVIKNFSTLRIEVFVLNLKQYLDMFWGHLTTAMEVYKSIQVAAAHPEEEKSKEYFEYYKTEMLESGIKSGKFISGRLNVNKHCSRTEAFVARGGVNDSNKSGGSGTDILIAGNADRNRTVDGDLVVVELLPKSEWKSKSTHLVHLEEKEKDEGLNWERGADVMATGRVVGVMQRNWGDYIATLPRQEEDSMEKAAGKRILVYPYNRKIPKIRILTSQFKSLQGHRVLVRIDAWPVNSQYPQGHFLKVLGKIGDLETEIDTILLENDIEVTPFSQGILSELPSYESSLTWVPDPEQIESRKDLRKVLVMSIDPIGCEDVDDALSVRKLDDGNLEVGVHIADVTHFVPVNSLTDLEARKRATTVYLADRRYDMLPPVLSAQLCSLLGSVQRYAVSCIWEIHPKTYRVKNVWYGKTVIKSSYKLCYEHAQDIIDGKTELEMKEVIPELSKYSGKQLKEKFLEVKESLTYLSTIAKKWQNTRLKEGALNLESTEVQFEFEEKSMTNIKPKEHLAIHETVAECMIMANHWVARKISEVFPGYSILRLHPPPKKDNFEELKICAKSKGWTVETFSNKSLAESLDRCTDSHDPTVNFLLRSLATTAMVQAVYFSTGSMKQEEWNHYGLALDKYTHFTSPIRRYADVLVHRLLLAAVSLTKSDWWGGGEVQDKATVNLLGNTQLQDLCTHINSRNRAAQRAQRDSQVLFQTLYFKDRPLSDPRCVVDAVIFSLRENGFLVYIPQYAIKGPVYLESKEKEVLYCGKLGPTWQLGVVTKKEMFVKVETLEGTNMYRRFDHVTVGIQLKGSEAHAHVLSFTLLDSQPWKGDGEGEERAVNFLREVRMEQKEDSSEEEEMVEQVGGKRKKPKINAYEFFEEMRKIGVRPLNCDIKE